MSNGNKLVITLNKDRVIQKIEGEDFMIKFNGHGNKAYKDMLAPLGIELRFDESVDEPRLKTNQSAINHTEGTAA